ncbi:MAG: hypothetical protein WC315_07025 [Candidatus Omnitrophota bacterium]|jgi:hypothetical protein
MRNSLIISLTFLSALIFGNAWTQNNLSAVDVLDTKQKDVSQPDKPVSQELAGGDKPLTQEKQITADNEQGMEKIRAYHELFNNRQKELELIKLDLEKSSLLLKKKEAEKELYQIEKMLPQGKKEEFSGSFQDAKEPRIDPSDIKIQFLLISEDLKESQIRLKGTVYFFQEGDTVASKLTAEKIEPSGVTFRQQDGSILKLNFIS